MALRVLPISSVCLPPLLPHGNCKPVLPIGVQALVFFERFRVKLQKHVNAC